MEQNLNISLQEGDNLNLNLRNENLNITLREGGGGSSSDNYNELRNKPQIEGVVLQGNKTFEDLKLIALTNREIEALLN